MTRNTQNCTENINCSPSRPVKSALIIKALVSHKATSGVTMKRRRTNIARRRKSVSLAFRPFVKGLCCVSGRRSGFRHFGVLFSDSSGVHQLFRIVRGEWRVSQAVGPKLWTMEALRRSRAIFGEVIPRSLVPRNFRHKSRKAFRSAFEIPGLIKLSIKITYLLRT